MRFSLLAVPCRNLARVPKKTVYGCWRQWGLKGYRAGRYLRFRDRHVEEWLRNQEA